MRPATLGKLLTRFVVLGLAMILAIASIWLGNTLPNYDGIQTLESLERPVAIGFDAFAIPEVRADSRLDAYRALGYLHAQERLLQMDLMRRKMAGELSEVVGDGALYLDIRQRTLGFYRIAATISKQMPAWQQAICHAYSQGVNGYLQQADTLSPEFTLLRYRPGDWSCRDTILVSLAMFQMLNEESDQERMLRVMYQALPRSVVDFLTPDISPLDQPLIGQPCGHRPIQPIPVGRLKEVLAEPENAMSIIGQQPIAASNQWVVAGWKSSDGQALLANDMHLPLSVPNIWYRVRLRYGSVTLDGITLPGLPLVIAGDNGWISWGFTNAVADVIDLVLLTTDPQKPGHYRTPRGWEKFQIFHEEIRIKNQSPFRFTARATRWGPVAADSLLNQPVAVHWSIFEPGAVELSLLALDQARSVQQALPIFKISGIPVLNATVADAEGHIGWTLTGKLPKREGFDGSISLDWSATGVHWQGWLPPSRIPQLIDPPQGFIVTANDLVVGCDQPLQLGHNFAYGARAQRLRQTLAGQPFISRDSTFALQLDTQAEFYRFYQQLALSVLPDPASPLHEDLRRALEAWNGRADSNSLGLPLLVRFHQRLENAIFAALLEKCRRLDPHFRYRWLKREVPLRQLLSQRPPELVPEPGRMDWQHYLLKILLQTAEELRQQHGKPLRRLTWGEVNRARITHPLSRGQPLLSRFLDMPPDPLPGCRYCVRVALPDYGASMRLVALAGDLQASLLQMPTGQSGHFLSSHYHDQHPYWTKGLPLPLAPGPVTRQLKLLPN